MEDDPLLPAQRADGRNVLDDANLVVHEHHRNEDGVGPHGRAQRIQVQQTVLPDIEIGGLETLALELTDRIQNGLVLGLDRDDVLALGPVELGSPLDGQVVAFGRAAGPDDLPRVGADEGGHMEPRLLNRLFGFPTPRVGTGGRVAEMLGQPWNHGLGDARVHRIGGPVVHVDRQVRRHWGLFIIWRKPTPGRKPSSAR